MLSAAGSVLVAGSTRNEEPMQTKTVIAKRGFWYQGKMYQKGDSVEVPSMLASELRASAKAELKEDHHAEVEAPKAPNKGTEEKKK